MNYLFMELLLTEQIKEAINTRINGIMGASDWEKAMLPLSLNKIKDRKMNNEEVTKEIDIWADLAKLSLNLWIDYDYHKQFSFKGRHNGGKYEETLRNLGFVWENGYWVSGSRPSLEDVHMSVFMHCLYLSVHEQMRGSEEARMAEENERRLRGEVEEAADMVDEDEPAEGGIESLVRSDPQSDVPQSGGQSGGGVSRPEGLQSASDLNKRQSDVRDKQEGDNDGLGQEGARARNKDGPVMCPICDTMNSGNNNQCDICQAELDPYEVPWTAADGDKRVTEPIKSEVSNHQREVKGASGADRGRNDMSGRNDRGGIDARKIDKKIEGNKSGILSAVSDDTILDQAEVRDMGASKGDWNCPSCTFLNKAGINKCAVCESVDEPGTHKNKRHTSSDSDNNSQSGGNTGRGRGGNKGNGGHFQSLGAGHTSGKLEVNATFYDDFGLDNASVEESIVNSINQYDSSKNNNNNKSGGSKSPGAFGGNLQSLDRLKIIKKEDPSSSLSRDIFHLDSDCWSCPSCALNNKKGSLCCGVCYTIRPREDAVRGDEGDDFEVVEADDIPQASWRCLHCKKDNSFDTYICQSCRKYAPFFQKWVCERCAFFNDKLARECAVCDKKNAYLKFCDKCKIGVVHLEDKVRQCADCIKREREAMMSSGKTDKLDTMVAGLTEYRPEACPRCKRVLEVPTDGMCRKCMTSQYYCNNRHCGAINDSRSKHCRKCKVKKGDNITDYNVVDVYKGRVYIKMWQCTFCGLLNTKTKCRKCRNLRHSSAYKKCLCKWVNLTVTKKCDKCFQILR